MQSNLTKNGPPSTESEIQLQQVISNQEDSERVQIQRVVPKQTEKENEADSTTLTQIPAQKEFATRSRKSDRAYRRNALKQ